MLTRASNLSLSRPTVKFREGLSSAFCRRPSDERPTNYLMCYRVPPLSVCASFKGHDDHNQPHVGERAILEIECNWWRELWAGCSVCKQITGWLGWDPLRVTQHGCWYVVCKTSGPLMNYTWENTQQGKWQIGENKRFRGGENNRKTQGEREKRERARSVTIRRKTGVVNHQESNNIFAGSKEPECFCYFRIVCNAMLLVCLHSVILILNLFYTDPKP